MNLTRSTPWSGALALALGLSLGCAPALTGNEPREASTQVPTTFGQAATDANASSSKAANAGQQSWETFFPDPELTGLIDTALKNNQELNIGLQEILIAKSEIMARSGEYQPKVGVGAGVGAEKVGRYTSQGASDEANGLPEPLMNYQFGFTASWEVDIWKKLRNAAKSAVFRYLASIEGRKLIVTRIVAEIANSYYELLALDTQLDVLAQNIEIQQSALEVVKLQKAAGRATELAVQRFEAEVLKNRSRKFDLQQQVIEAENRINFLVGRYPQPVTRDPKKFNTPVPKAIQTGVPSQLLDNRPDIKQAELELKAAKLDVKVAKAGFYPSLSIEAGVGYQAFNAKHLVTTPESLLYNLAGNLTAPLLNRKAIEAQYYTANAQQLQAVYNYERALLRAVTDVANQLSMLDNLQNSYELEAQQVELLTQSIEVSNVLFRSARADYMEVLLTRRDALESQMDLIDTKLAQRHATVNVYQALGGGWR